MGQGFSGCYDLHILLAGGFATKVGGGEGDAFAGGQRAGLNDPGGDAVGFVRFDLQAYPGVVEGDAAK